MNAQTIEAVGKVGIQTVAVIGVFFLGYEFISKMVPILEAQTAALEAIAKAYAGYTAK